MAVTFQIAQPFDLERSGIVLGDLVSAYLGVLYGTDPTPVDAIVRLKASLADPGDTAGEGSTDPSVEDSDPR